MNQVTCRSCVHYRQHYALDQHRFFQVYCGHCTRLRIKARRPDAKICENYVQTESDEKAFVTKEYLSKALLDYMLKLDLLPQLYGTEQETEIKR